MSLLRQWQLLDVLMPTLLVLGPLERIVAWNIGHIDDAVAVALAHLHHRSAPVAGLVVFHSGVPPARRPVQWAKADLRGVPKEPWLQPVPGYHNRWSPHPQVLESVLLAAPPGPVDLLVGARITPADESRAALASVRRGGHLLLADPPPPGSLPADHWAPAESTGHLYRKLSEPPGQPAAVPDDGPKLSLARHHEQALLIHSYANLARSLAHRFANRGERAEDLEQIATLALIKAAGRYEPGDDRPFGPYATASITGELKRHFRDHVWAVRVPRSVQETHLAIRSARDDLTQAKGASPTIGELAEYLGVTEETVLSAMETVTNSWAVSLDALAPDGDSGPTEIPVTDSGFESTLDRRLLMDAIKELSPTERSILKQVFFDGKTQRQVAEELRVSQMQISRIMAKTLAKMKLNFQPA